MNLFKQGETALEDGDFFSALESFLTLREQRLDLARVLGTAVWVDKTEFFDLTRSGSKDLVVLTRNRGIVAFSSTGVFPVARLDFPGSNSFALYRGGGGEIFLVVGGKQGSEPCRLRVYRIEQARNEEIHFPLAAKLAIGDVQIHDIAYKRNRNRIYVAASNGHIYQYDGLSYERQEEEAIVDPPIARFYTGGQLDGEPDERQQRDTSLLAITEAGTLARFTLGQPLRERQRSEASIGALRDLLVADLDNDGISNIVACTRDGRVIVLDWDTLQIEYEYAAFDVFHCVFCADIDGDGRTEILVGARSGKLYVLELNKNHELAVKWIYQTEHEIWAIQAADNKPLKILLALGNGRIQLYDVYCQGVSERRLNEKIRETSQQLAKSPTPELGDLFAKTDIDTVMEFALDNYARRMGCDELVVFLGTITAGKSPADYGVILGKLPGFLDKCRSSEEMTDFVSDLLARVAADSASDWSTYEQLSDVLNRIALSGASKPGNQAVEFARDFRNKPIARTGVEINRFSQIKAHIERGELEQAEEKLRKLAQQGLDLLYVYESSAGIRRLYGIRKGKALVVLGQNNTLTIFDDIPDGESSVVSPVMQDMPVAYARQGRQKCPHIVFSGKSAVGFTNDLTSRRTICQYEARIRCAVHIDRTDGYIRVVGLRNGLLLFGEFDASGEPTEGASGERELELDSFPVAMVAHENTGTIDLYVFTVTGGVVLFHDVGTKRDPWPEPTPIASLPRPANILDVACPDNGEGRPNVVALCHDRLIILRKDREWSIEEVPIAGGLTCMCPVTLPEDPTPRLMIGTAERSLVFYRLNDGSIRKVPLPYIPTALAVVDNTQDGIEIFVGFDRGDIYRYRIMKENELEALREQCGEKAQCMERCEGQWKCSNTYERLVSIALATYDECEQGRIPGLLDPKVAALLPRGVLRDATQHLEAEGIILGRFKEERLVYRIVDPNYKGWIEKTQKQNQFSIVRDNRESLIDDLPLSRFSLIDEELRSLHSREWVFTFLYLDREKWRRLVNVSRLFNACRVTPTKGSIGSAGFAYLESIMHQIPGRVVNLQSTSIGSVGMYEVTVPTIRFTGFDRILAFVVPSVTGETPNTIKKYWAVMDRPGLVLVLTPEKRDFLANYFHNDTFDVIILDGNDVKNIFLADEPGRELLNRIITQVNLSALSPFQIAGPVSDMFYGRKEELTSLLASLERPGWKNYAVVGPRRVGKTSLLHKVRAELQARKDWDTVYIDASSLMIVSDPTERLYAFFQTVLDKLHIAGTPQGFIAAMGAAYGTERKARLAIFVDEVDDLLKAGARHAEDIFPRTIRTLINEFNIKVVLAGYKSLYFQMKNKESALFNMSDYFSLAALDEKSAGELVQDPLSDVIDISEEVIRAICEKTGRFPNFIQRCCRLLLERPRVQQTRRVIEDDVLEVTKSRELFDHIVGVYVQNLQELTKLVFYLLLSNYDVGAQRFILGAETPTSRQQKKISIREQVRFTSHDLRGIVEKVGVRLTDNELHAVMDELVLACVLTPAEGKLYKFVLPDLSELMRNHEEILETTVNMLEQARESFLHY
uniref:TniB protein n=1 Tax=Candidatus Kentrum sp. FM TaxID=2126340 RepID=A0A450RYZ5_9GAMM|nr:MAG: TniB protein [Candidatus Kentron sp. FM]VFJ50158.1 MAG: TniB protein [Candidatus Kentron sp. FM]